MTTSWYQVEFYSRLEKRWVPIFAKQETEAAAREQWELVAPGRRRVVKVTQIVEEVVKGETQ
jgi:hypothetical protein